MERTKGLKMKRNVTAIVTVLAVTGLATAAWASGGGGEHHADSGALLKDFLYRCLNFGVTFGLLAYFVTKPIRKGLAGRREGIEKSLQEAKVAQQAAEAKFAEYDQKLAKASSEIDDIYASIKREGELERDRILAEAKETAKKIEAEAQQAAALEVSKASGELRQEAARLAIEIAREILNKKITEQDQTRLVDEYMQKVGELH